MSNISSHIFLIDDDYEMRSLLKDFLIQQGNQVTEFSSAVDAKSALQENLSNNHLDLVISDINMPGMTGLELTEHLKKTEIPVPIILMTAYGSIETAIDAIKKGAFDYVTKPFSMKNLGIVIDRALNYGRLQRDNTFLRATAKKSSEFSGILGKSTKMRQIFDLIERVAPANANVLITGESGTGKEKVARAIHELGPRSSRPFIAINCAAIPDALLESELFGHAKGSFTGAAQRKKGLFEEADGGTVFLDEIGDLDLPLQAKLLRVIQEKRIRYVGDTVDRPVDVRILSATHKDLKVAISNGTFREDLYYRLSVIPILVPPLRHRTEDIPLLADFFLKKYSSQNGSNVRAFTPDAMKKLVSFPWMGNVRELENLIERCVVLARGSCIEESDLLLDDSEVEDESFFSQATDQIMTLNDLEKRYIRFVLEKTGGKKEKASHLLGINRRTLYRKEREYGWLTEDSFEPREFS